MAHRGLVGGGGGADAALVRPASLDGTSVKPMTLSRARPFSNRVDDSRSPDEKALARMDNKTFKNSVSEDGNGAALFFTWSGPDRFRKKCF